MKLITAIVLASAYVAGSATFYTDKTVGSDTYDGTSLTYVSGTTGPKATIGAGLGLCTSAGDTLYVAGDGEVYAESITPSSFGASGTSWSAPVTLAGYSTHTVTIRPTGSPSRVFNLTGGTAREFLMISNFVIHATNTTFEAIKISDGTGKICISDCEIYGVWDSMGIQCSKGDATGNAGGTNIFRRLTIHDIGNDPTPTDPNHAIYVRTDGNLVEYCILYDMASHGIHQFGGPYYNNTYRYNTIYRTFSNADIGIGIYSEGTNNMVYGNLIYSLAYTPIRINADNNFVYNNTMAHCAGGLELGGNGVTAANNILAYCGNGFAQSGIYNLSSYTGVVLNNNLAFDCPGGNENMTGSYTGSGNLIGDSYDAAFAATNSANYRLTVTSDAIDAGTSLSGIFTTDFDGNTYGADGTWDMGAFEFQSGGGGGDPATAVKRRGKIPGLGRGRGSWR